MSGAAVHRVPAGLVARLAAVLLVLAALIAIALVLRRRGLPPAPTVTLLSRSAHRDDEKATFSFEHGVRDDPDGRITRNDWDVQFGNGGDHFTVNMVTDDRSRITDLGVRYWPKIAYLALPALSAHPAALNPWLSGSRQACPTG